MFIFAAGECDKKTRIGYGFQDRENPFREERFRGRPLTIPANSINGRSSVSRASSI